MPREEYDLECSAKRCGNVDTWKEDERRVEVFDMWVMRRMEKMKWTERRRNDEGLDMVGEKRQLLDEMQRRQKL